LLAIASACRKDIVLWSERGQTPDDIVTEFPQLTLADVHAALAYYYDHQAEIDAQIAVDEEFVAAMKAHLGKRSLEEPRRV
jgi:hypothetical protein